MSAQNGYLLFIIDCQLLNEIEFFRRCRFAPKERNRERESGAVSTKLRDSIDTHRLHQITLQLRRILALSRTRGSVPHTLSL